MRLRTHSYSGKRGSNLPMSKYEPDGAGITQITEFDTKLVDELTRVEAEAFGDGGLDRWMFPVLIRHGAVYVLDCAGRICGVADIIKDWLDPELAFIYNFAIRKEYRGKGLGRVFLSGVIERLRDYGVRRIQLTVAHENSRAISLYQGAGFRQIAELPDEYGPGADRLLYELELEG